ncbi:hypothetical protein VTL71DRAFT_812 [Oculimacula yallundae]|uniref:Cyanovirin-N domain-containing protein n=1 Tax=Oculimacula yallundae TaxID=86028 RepID=A0ABR4D1B2_9HELO
MHFTSTLLTVALIATGSTTYATCYDSGVGSHSVSNIIQVEGAIRDLCQNGALAGYFNEGQSKQICVPVNDGNIHFEVQTRWLGRGGLTLRNDDCLWRLNDVLHRCYGQGGEIDQYDWFFRVDPQEGKSC